MTYVVGRQHGGGGYSFMPAVVLDGHGTRWAKTWIDRAEPQPRVEGMTVAFDLGVQYRGYTSDFGRSVFIGEPRDEPLRAWQSITKAIQAAMAVMGDGKITPAGIHDFVVESVSADGFRDQFSWYALGHSIGLDVHENPWMLPEFTEPIRSGMCFALEPKNRPPRLLLRPLRGCLRRRTGARPLADDLPVRHYHRLVMRDGRYVARTRREHVTRNELR